MEFKEVAVLSAKEAGKTILEISERGFTSRMKGNPHDIITEADTKAEEIVVGMIRKHFPRHSILSEEMGKDKKDSEYLWIIDPLDGTINFSKGIQEYCVSIALEHKGELILGVIYDPVRDDLYVAERGKGAFLNGNGLKVSKERASNNMILAFDNTSNIRLRKMTYRILSGSCHSFRSIREFGSGALHLTKVASGKIDVYFNKAFHYWDFAAGKILVEEAGGKVTDFHCNPIEENSKNIVATNGKVHEELLKILNKK